MNSPRYLSCFAVVILLTLGVASNVVAKSPNPARIMKTKVQLAELQNALEIYKLDNGEYPAASQGLQALIERPVGTPAALNWGEVGCLGRLPKDPWGREYRYRNPGVVDPVEVIRSAEMANQVDVERITISIAQPMKVRITKNVNLRHCDRE